MSEREMYERMAAVQRLLTQAEARRDAAIRDREQLVRDAIEQRSRPVEIARALGVDRRTVDQILRRIRARG